MEKLLADLKNNYNAKAVKAEFEAEGATFDEALRLKKIAHNAGLGFTVKIGGCEAVKDLKEAKIIGADAVTAPMIESAYAFKKFIAAAKPVFGGELYINIETVTGFNCLDEILEDAQSLCGIVFGRTDMCGSLGLGCSEADSARIFEYAKIISEKTRLSGKKFLIGGNICPKSIDFLGNLPYLSGFETRKIIFNTPASAQGILKAIEFELMWLRCTNPQSKRTEILEKRCRSTVSAG
ncbi:MAG: aldolase [Heliobacteriaceae bacterium]|jgi:hypothetical protein|nr:aldolase [Heliobacteriaceae bacterium]